MVVTCGSCGTEDDSGSAYCLNPSCGAVLVPTNRAGRRGTLGGGRRHLGS